MTLGNQLHM